MISAGDQRGDGAGGARGLRALVVACVAVCVLASGSLLAVGPGGGPAVAAAAPKVGAANQGRLDALVGFLQDTQNDDGGYGGSPGADSDPMISAWVGIGLAAAGINPQDQKPSGTTKASVATYLAGKGPQRTAGKPPVTTEYARIGMFANAAGMDPRRFGGRDYVSALLARQSTVASTANAMGIPPGWFPHIEGGQSPGVNDTIFAVFFLAGTNDTKLREPIVRAAKAIEAMQRPDGTWPAVRPGDATNVDMTGAAIQALCVARRCQTEAVRTAVAWLRAHQQPDGGWQAGDMADETTGESNSGTTPWVVQALWAVGQDPAKWRRGGKDPLDFLASLQRRDGSIRWRESRDMNPTWMTAYSAPAFAGHAWPVPAPPRAAAARAAAKELAAKQTAAKRQTQRRLRDERQQGDAGETDDGDGSTQTGGGGRGAELFSRPQPQSQGATTGGVRDTERQQERQRGTQGKDGATGTAAASGVGSDGGVQNAPKPETTPPSGSGLGDLVDGQVVESPRGTQGQEREQAVAAGLRSARAGGTSPPWATAGLGGLMAVCLLVGARIEARPPSRRTR